MGKVHKHKPITHAFGQYTNKYGCVDVNTDKLISILDNAVLKIRNIEDSTLPLEGNTANLIDPIATAFEVGIFYDNDKDKWANSEILRARQKSLMNIVGDLQQSVVSCLPNWVSHPSGTNSPDI